MIKPQVIDKVLGEGIAARWERTLKEFGEEQNRAEVNAKRYATAWGTSLKTQLQADLAFADKVLDDYEAFLEQVSASGTGKPADGEKIFDIYLLAISILIYDNDILDEIFGLGIAALLAALAAASVDQEAKQLQAVLKKLQQELEKAKREVKEAWAQTAINGAIFAIGLCTGPLGWLTLAGVGLGQMVADTYLGPSTSAAATWGSRGATTLGTAVSASEKYLAESSKALKVVKPGGKVIPVVGFLFDANEIKLAYNNVDFLKNAMADAKKAQEELLAKLNTRKATLATLALKLEDLRRVVDGRGNSLDWIAETRQSLESEMRRLNYRPRP